jgi:CHAT domain-containing protein
MSIPWEFLYYPNRRMFLAPQEDLPIVRFLSVGSQSRPMRVKLPLRVLAMASSPSDLVPLNVAEERDKLMAALQELISKGMVEVDWIDDGDMSSLYQYLTNTRKQHHIFHFIGHGGFNEKSGQGYLAMEGSGKHHVSITGDRLAPLLTTGRRRFRLAVLNACEGARTGLTDPFAGMATSLMVVCNLPAVVAMQFEISDKAAITFASKFYGALSTGRPVDTAVTNARLAIWATHTDVEWGTPVLYMRSLDGRLFDFSGHSSK